MPNDLLPLTIDGVLDESQSQMTLRPMPDRSLRTCVSLPRRPTLKWLYRYHWSVVIAVCYIDLQDHLKEGTGRVCHRLQRIEFGQRKYPKNSWHGPMVCLVKYCFHR